MVRKILIANRGEIALRIARTAADMGVGCVGALARDDVAAGGIAVAKLQGAGPAAYLDISDLLDVARREGCDAVHPGYGFLSERADFALRCRAAGLTWIGPEPDHLALFGDKARARALAAELGIPLAPGMDRAVSLEEARAFLAAQNGGAIMIKAIGGGGGRGMRVVGRVEDLEDAYRRAASEALNAFGSGDLYVERRIERARHIEVQIVGDGVAAMSLGERDCTLQRRFQKWVEIAPSPAISPAMREALTAAALKLAGAKAYRNLGTFEFLVDEGSPDLPFVFIEANPRLQVEHTVTEEVTGLDLVRLQIELARGASLASLGLDPKAPPKPRGYAIQWRVNVETILGPLRRFAPPAGPGLRVDTAMAEGQPFATAYDALMAKLIVKGADFSECSRRSRRALGEFVIEGARTHLPVLRALAAREDFATQTLDTLYLDSHWEALRGEALAAPSLSRGGETHEGSRAELPNLPNNEAGELSGALAVRAPMAGRVVEICVGEGDDIIAGAPVAVLEAMKMEHLVLADHSGRAKLASLAPGDQVGEGDALVYLIEAKAGVGEITTERAIDLDHIRPDLARLLERRAATLDAARPAAMAKRHALKMRGARENIADLFDPGSFQEYGAFAVAAQRGRRSLADLIANTPADGVITGTGAINGALFTPDKARAAVVAYDATVLAGTQGLRGHEKTDRIIEIAERDRLPMVLFAEGGGGRPGDVDADMVAGLHLTTFARFAALSGHAPVVGIAAGRCFAGNAALLGCADVIIATRDSNIGMGGPAMIEGGGLGKFRPEEIGPSDVQAANGVIDILVENEIEAVASTQQYLSYFQGRVASWRAGDPRALRAAVPENRLRAYDMRALMRALLDEGSMLELRPGFGRGMFTALGRIEGFPLGVMANNPSHLGGAIDADAADKGARFMRLCGAHGLPMLSLVDTPGFMVGPQIETKAQVRHVSRLFVAAASLSAPYFSIVTRKGYGLGAMAMTAGGFHSPDFNVSWPSGEFGGMGLEGAVRLGYRKELEAASDEAAREALFKQLLAKQYEAGGALNMASMLEIDAVIDPAESRAWLVRGLASAKPRARRSPTIDTW